MRAVTKDLKKKPLISLKGAKVTRAGRAMLSGVDWVLEPGRHWAVLGANGAGKSTFLRLVRGDMPPDSHEQRTYCFDGLDQNTPIGLRERIGLVSPELQDTYASRAWKVSGLEVVLAGMYDTPLLYGKPEPEQVLAAREVMNELGIADLGDRLMQAMSTGQARKIFIARALACRPKILVLDETLDGLDAASRKQVLELIDRASASAQIICAAHRLDEVPGCITDVLLLRGGRIQAGGSREEMLSRAAGVYEIRSEPLPKSLPAPASRLSIAGGTEPEMILEIEKAHAEIHGRKILSDMNWKIRAGEKWVLLGENGAGKSTLLKMITGEVAPLAGGGVVRFGDPDMRQVDAAKRIGLVSAGLHTDFEYDLTVEETIWSGFHSTLGLYQEVDREQRARAHELVFFFGLGSLARKSIRSLSYGQLRKTLIARALASDPELLLLDEPLSGLDPAAREEVREILKILAAGGLAMVYVTHRPGELIEDFDRVLVLKEGRIAFKGSIRDCPEMEMP